MNNAELIHRQRKQADSDHWQTPSWIIESARKVMGTIDLDPASSAQANERVKASQFFGESINALRQQWFGNVWLNPPFSLNDEFMPYLVNEYNTGRVKQACVISFASTETAWFRCLINYPICFFDKRINYLAPQGVKASGATKASSVAYLGPNLDRFAQVFGEYGYIMVRYPYQIATTQPCAICGKPFMPKRADALYCSAACNQKAKRQRAKLASE